MVEEEHAADALAVSVPTGDIGDGGNRRDRGLATKPGSPADASSQRTHGLPGNTSINESTTTEKGGMVKVPVNEDFLFDVDIQARELAPTYWLGPIYDVRRGSWFYQEGSVLRPCDENLAIQLEEGYLKVKPWRNERPQSTPQPKTRPVSTGTVESAKPTEKVKDEATISKNFDLQTQRLFGTYMNSVVTYQDATTAWILTDDLLSRMSSTVYQRFAGGGHLGGVKVVRGFSEASKAKEDKKDNDKNPSTKSYASTDSPKRQSGVAKADADTSADEKPSDLTKTEPEPRLLTLERQLSSFSGDRLEQEEERRQADENEIKEDYKDAVGQDQGREIEHLILVTHGIGQVSETFSRIQTLR